MATNNLLPYFLAGFLAIALTSASAQTTLYTENFSYVNGSPSPASGSGNNISSNTCYQNAASESTVGWFIYGKSSGGTVSDLSAQVSASEISDRQSPNGSTSGPSQYGWPVVGTAAGSSYLLATTSAVLSNSAISVAAPNLTFSWYQGDAAAADTVRLAIKVGGTWYVSTTTFSTAAQGYASFGAAPGSTASLFNPTFASLGWNALTFTVGASPTLVMGGPVAAPATGNITGIGFYSNSLTGIQRFNTLQITTTPAPIAQTINDADWNSAAWGTPAAAPVSNTKYATAAGLAGSANDGIGVAYTSTVRASDNGGTNTFGGASLTLSANTRLLLAQQAGGVASANLILGDQSNVVLASNATGTVVLAGTLSVPSGANAYLGLSNSGGASLNVTSTVTGSGTLNVGITGSGLNSEVLNLTGDLSAFAGTVNVYTGGAFGLTSPMENGMLAFTSTAGTFALNGPLNVGALTVGGNTVAGGSYTAAQLDALTQSNLFVGSGNLTVVPPSIQTSDGRLTVSVFRSGAYSVASSVTGWTFQGILPNALTSLSTTTGSDSIGVFQQISFSWLDASSRAMTGSINLYNGQDTLVFSDTLANTSASGPSPFPSFTTVPQGLSKFCYANSVFTPPAFNLQANASMPWVLFDASADTLVISPASHFLPSTLLGDGTSLIASGFNSGLANVPAGFTQQTMMAVSRGINRTFNVWGHGLTSLYNKTNPANDADILLRYFGIWTDVGANYYYNYNSNAAASGQSAYGATLGNLVADFNQKSIPVRYMQLDSWWYDKSNVYWNGGNAGGYHSGLPQQAWALYGGALNWVGDDYLFPSGVSAFSSYLGAKAATSTSSPAMPLVAHGRFIDTTSTLTSTPSPSVHPTFYAQYGNTYSNDFAGIAGISARFWNDRAAYAQTNNIQSFEQDWLYDIVAGSPTFITSPSVADQFFGNMSLAFATRGIDIQYCQTLPATFLQACEYSNVTTTRVTDDHFTSGRYHDAIYGSRLATSVGLWPWVDVFNSTETNSLLLADLSAGVVGTGDAQGNESASNLFLALRADGVIVKPDLPLMPTDGAFITEAAAGQNSGAPLIASTTSYNGITTTYAVAIPQSNSSGTTTATFSMSDLGLTQPAYFYNYFAGAATRVSPGGSLTAQVAPLSSGSFPYFIIAPVGSSGIAFLGDQGKFVSNGKKRIATVTDQPGLLTATVLFAPTENQVILHGYTNVPPTVAVQAGSASTVSYDAASGHFSVTITVSQNASLSNDIDPVRKVVVALGTGFPNWQKMYFGADAGNPAIAGGGANPSGDGVSNLTKYALGLDPNVASQVGLPSVTLLGQNGNLQIQFRRNLSASDISFLVQVSVDLASWTNIATLSPGSASWTTQNAMVTDNGGQVTVTETSSTPPAGGKQFIRLMNTR